MDPATIVLNHMTIVVRLHHLPINLQSGSLWNGCDAFILLSLRFNRTYGEEIFRTLKKYLCKDFPFGEWLKAAPRGEGSGRVRMPLQPIPSPMALHSRTLLEEFKFLALGGAIREEIIHHLW